MQMQLIQICHRGLHTHVPNTAVTKVSIHIYQKQQCHAGLHTHAPSVQQKSIVFTFHTPRQAVTSVQLPLNSKRFTFPIFVHSWHFTVFHSLQSITPRIY